MNQNQQRGSRHRGTIVLVLFAALMIVALPAMAAKGGTGGGKGHGGTGGTTSGGSISLVLLNSTDGLPHFGQQVTFNVSASFSQPWVNLNCYQNGTWVSGEWGGFFDGSAYDRIFTLGPSNSWTGGAADCKADLVEWTAKGSLVVRASTSFQTYS
jgi:hypothetical protein